MARRPSDIHWDLIGSRSERVVRTVVEVAKASARPYVLGGGWAVFTHVPSIPSVDCDLYAVDETRSALTPLLEGRGLEVGAGKEVEFLPFETPQELLGTGDPDLGIQPAAYVPSRLFAGRTTLARLRMRQPLDEIPVPTPQPMIVVKLCALRDRALAYRAHEDGAALALLGPSVAPMVLAQSQSYFLRKAGKDLVDAGLLLEAYPSARRDAVALARTHGLWAAITEGCSEIPSPIIDMARDAAARAGFGDPWAQVEDLVTL